VKKYLIYGMNGSGQSTAGEELERMGYYVIEADSEPGLSYWVNRKTGERINSNPPFTQKWLDENKWIWDSVKLPRLLRSNGADEVFLVGGADNMYDFMDLFDKKFVLHIDDETMRERLQAREPGRWENGSSELKMVLGWNKNFVNYHRIPGAILISGAQPIEKVVAAILENIK